MVEIDPVFENMRWFPVAMSEISRDAAASMRIQYEILKHKVRRIDLMATVNRKKDPVRVVQLNGERALIMSEIRQLRRDYKRAWKYVMGV